LSTANGNIRKKETALSYTKILIRVKYLCYQTFGASLLSTRENEHIFHPKAKSVHFSSNIKFQTMKEKAVS